MDIKTILLELILGGFFAIACIRSCVPSDPKRQIEFRRFVSFARAYRALAPLPLAVVFDGSPAARSPAAKWGPPWYWS